MNNGDLSMAVAIRSAAAAVSAGLCMAFGGLGPSLAQGMIGASACKALGENPELSKSIRNTMLLAMAVAETASVFAVGISSLLLFKVAAV